MSFLCENCGKARGLNASGLCGPCELKFEKADAKKDAEADARAPEEAEDPGEPEEWNDEAAQDDQTDREIDAAKEQDE